MNLIDFTVTKMNSSKKLRTSEGPYSNCISKPKVSNGHCNSTNGVDKGENEYSRSEGHSDEDIEFFNGVIEILQNEGFKATNPKQKVVEFLTPEEVCKTIDLEIGGERSEETVASLLELCRQTFHYSVKPASPRFFNQLFAGQDLYGLAGQWISDFINSSQYTFEVSPVFTMMEAKVLEKLRKCAGYAVGDGIFCPGGSIANMYAMHLAVFNYCPDIKKKGLFGMPRFAIFTSEQSHYSIKKGSSFLGFGTDSVQIVKCDASGRMIPEELEKQIMEFKSSGGVPLLVNATAGTTVMGAYDPLQEIADICSKHTVWFHVDAAWGGSALLSAQYKHYLNGIERSDSMTWCQHKMMGVPLQCSAFLLRGHKGLMQEALCAGASYLFQQDKFYDVSFDTGDKSIQCGRKVDCLKLWLMWKAKGDHGFEEEINIKFANSRYLADLVKKREGFSLIMEPQCTNVCFYYIPPCLQSIPKDSDNYMQHLSKVAPIIKERMVKKGSLLIGYQPLGGRVNFFRMVFSNAKTTFGDVDFLADEIEKLGKTITLDDINNYQPLGAQK